MGFSQFFRNDGKKLADVDCKLRSAVGLKGRLPERIFAQSRRHSDDVIDSNFIIFQFLRLRAYRLRELNSVVDRFSHPDIIRYNIAVRTPR